jgi:hypothetical protein
VSATASSGLAVSFSSTTTAVCTVTGATVTLIAAGTCTIQASQAGNSTYSAALPVSQSFAVIAASQVITFQTNIAGLQISVDGGAVRASPFAITLTTGTHTISAASIQPGSAGTQYVFTGWSDAGAASHSITVGTSAATYIATFKTQYLLTTAASPAAGGSISAGGYFDAGSLISITEAAGAGYVFANFSGAITGAVNPSTVTLTAAANVVANFTALAPSLAASVGARSDLVAGVTRLVSISLTNKGAGPATNATITGISAITVIAGSGAVSVASGVPVNLGSLDPASAGSGQIIYNWPSTATKVKFTVNFTADNGYTGSTTITTLR